jgi:flavodoxin
MTAKTLVVYASGYDSTREVANEIAKHLEPAEFEELLAVPPSHDQ